MVSYLAILYCSNAFYFCFPPTDFKVPKLKQTEDWSLHLSNFTFVHVHFIICNIFQNGKRKRSTWCKKQILKFFLLSIRKSRKSRDSCIEVTDRACCLFNSTNRFDDKNKYSVVETKMLFLLGIFEN